MIVFRLSFALRLLSCWMVSLIVMLRQIGLKRRPEDPRVCLFLNPEAFFSTFTPPSSSNFFRSAKESYKVSNSLPLADTTHFRHVDLLLLAFAFWRLRIACRVVVMRHGGIVHVVVITGAILLNGTHLGLDKLDHWFLIQGGSISWGLAGTIPICLLRVGVILLLLIL